MKRASDNPLMAAPGPSSFTEEATAIIAAAGGDGRAALATLMATFEDRLAIERAARLRAEAALVHAAAVRTAEEGYPCFPIGVIRSPFLTKRGTPRQGALAPDTRAVLTFSHYISPDALDGLAAFSHVYVMFLFSNDDGTPRVSASAVSASAADGAPAAGARSAPLGGPVAPWVRAGRLQSSKVCPPGLHGRRTGVFSTRSPHRPNSIGWSLCRLRHVHAGSRSLALAGIDFVDGTPVIDVKPACPYDCGSCGAAMPIVTEAALGGRPDEPVEAAHPMGEAAGGVGLPEGGCGADNRQTHGVASVMLASTATATAPEAGMVAPVRVPAWVSSPLHEPPPLRVVWEPAAEASARAFVLSGRSRFYGCAGGGSAVSEASKKAAPGAMNSREEADAFIRALAQCLGLDCRSVSHGRGTRATGHSTLVATARQEAAAAVLLGDNVCRDTDPSVAATVASVAPPQPPYELCFDGLLLRLRYREGAAAADHLCVVESCEEASAAAAATEGGDTGDSEA